VCATHILCCNFHSENSDLSYFVRFGVLADHVHRAKERGSVLRICFSPAPFCNLQSQRNGAGPFCSAKVGLFWIESLCRVSLLFAHDLFGKPASTFPHHGLGQSRTARVSNERPRLKAFCRVAFSVRLRLRAMLAARVFLPANRFNMRMSRLVHARLFIDVLRD
jgi:hypothetical protein